MNCIRFCPACGAQMLLAEALAVCADATLKCSHDCAGRARAEASRVPTGVLRRDPSLASPAEKFQVLIDLLNKRDPADGWGRAYALFGLDFWLQGDPQNWVLHRAVAEWARRLGCQLQKQGVELGLGNQLSLNEKLYGEKPEHFPPSTS